MEEGHAMALRCTIGYLYGSLMNLYGDRGNILTLVDRCRRRGIECQVVPVGLGEPIPVEECDLYFFGGGQDLEQARVAADLVGSGGSKAARLRQALEAGAVALCVCGGYQLLGHYYRPHGQPELPGAGIVDCWTVAGDTRFIGNAVAACDLSWAGRPSMDGRLSTLVGFENHSGCTYLGPAAQPLGRVHVGAGNNGRDGTEGAVCQVGHGWAVGTYLHGPILPKNPHLADVLICLALRRSHGDVDLAPLDDTEEVRAHTAARARAHALRR
jgi:CobQ-like glutamine amidotransferase family enzyme